MTDQPSNRQFSCRHLTNVVLDWVIGRLRRENRPISNNWVGFQDDFAVETRSGATSNTHGTASDDARLKVDLRRQVLIERFLPQSKSHLVARLRCEHTLPNEETYDHLILSRYVLFEKDSDYQVLSMFFSKGIANDGFCRYQFHCILDGQGNVVQLKEYSMEKVGREYRGKPIYFRPEETEGWRMEEMTAHADAFLESLETAESLDRLPRGHRLLRPKRFEARFER